MIGLFQGHKLMAIESGMVFGIDPVQDVQLKIFPDWVWWL
jgi:hypothetical protein